jgi:hypothetical protein
VCGNNVGKLTKATEVVGAGAIENPACSDKTLPLVLVLAIDSTRSIVWLGIATYSASRKWQRRLRRDTELVPLLGSNDAE